MSGEQDLVTGVKDGYYRIELNKTVWEVPKRYQMLSPVGTGAYGQVWWVNAVRECHCHMWLWTTVTTQGRPSVDYSQLRTSGTTERVVMGGWMLVIPPPSTPHHWTTVCMYCTVCMAPAGALDSHTVTICLKHQQSGMRAVMVWPSTSGLSNQLYLCGCF